VHVLVAERSGITGEADKFALSEGLEKGHWASPFHAAKVGSLSHLMAANAWQGLAVIPTDWGCEKNINLG
jgi:hypothetical protein